MPDKESKFKELVYSKEEINEFCLKYDIGALTVKRKLEKGLSLEDIANSLNYIDICGMLFKSYKDISEYFDVPYQRLTHSSKDEISLMKNLIKSPLFIKDAIYSKGTVIYKGKVYNGFYEIAKEEKIPYPLFAKSLNETLCIEESINLIKKGNYLKVIKGLYKKPKTLKYNPRKPISYKGVTYPSIKSLCLELGVSYKTISHRLNKGIPLEEALSLKIKSTSKEIVLFGKSFKTVKDAYCYYGVDANKVRYLMSKGLSREDAIKILKNV